MINAVSKTKIQGFKPRNAHDPIEGTKEDQGAGAATTGALVEVADVAAEVAEAGEAEEVAVVVMGEARTPKPRKKILTLKWKPTKTKGAPHKSKGT